MSHWTQLTHERLHPPLKIAAVVRLALDDGMALEDVLQGTGLDAPVLRDAACRTSIAQHDAVCRNTLALARDPAIAFQAGRSLHLSDHGLYGLLLMSCASMRDHLALAWTYQRLTAPLLMFDWRVGEGDDVCLRLAAAGRPLPEGLEAFLTELQLMQLLTHLGDALGTPVQPTLARFAYPAPAHRALYEQQLGCHCVFDSEHTGLQFPNELLLRRPCLANPVAAAALQSACDGLLAEIDASLGFAGKVHRTLRERDDPGAGMKAVAAALEMTERTLRRRLAGEGTSFSAIAHEVRYSVAARHLQRSDTSIDQIASLAGFSDPANFRRAFIRWTRMTPAQFRRQHVS